MFGVRQVVDGVRVSKGYMYASQTKKKIRTEIERFML